MDGRNFKRFMLRLRVTLTFLMLGKVKKPIQVEKIFEKSDSMSQSPKNAELAVDFRNSILENILFLSHYKNMISDIFKMT